MGKPVDPTPFEATMPAEMQQSLTEARAGQGVLARWLVNDEGGWGQVGDCFALLRTAGLSPVIVGWAVGIAMFGDDLNALSRMMRRERHFGVVHHVADAFAAGVAAGVPCMKRQWKGIEDLIKQMPSVPSSVVAVLPIALGSNKALERGVGLRLAQRAGAEAPPAIEAARAQATEKKLLKRLNEALATLQPEAEPLAGGRLGQADLLLRLLAAWPGSHDAALADAIVRVGKEVAQGRPALQGKSKGELEGAWLALAAQKDPTDVERLIATPWPGKWKVALERVAALATFPPDPRIARGLLDVAASYSSQGSFALHQRIAQVVGAIADPSCLQLLEAAHLARKRLGYRQYESTLEQLRRLDTSAPPPELLADARGIGANTRDLESLWKLVFDEPDHPEHRLVLADALQEAGDPRGELITLQHAEAEGRADTESKKRIKALLKENIDRWTGPLPDVEKASRRFERGFLVALRSSAGRQALDASRGCPQWRTVEELTLTSWHDAAELVRQLPCLRHLSASDDTLRSLAKGTALPRLEVLGGASYTPRAEARQAFPNVRLLARRSSPDEDAWAALGDFFASLHQSSVLVCMGVRGESIGETISRWREHGPAELRFTTGGESLAKAEGAAAWLTRGSDEANVRWLGGGSWRRRDLATTLRALVSAGYRRLRVRPGTAKQVFDDVRGELERRGAVLEALRTTLDLTSLPPT